MPEIYPVLRSSLMAVSVLTMVIGFFIRDDKEFSFKLFGVGVISALLAIASAISAKG